MATVRRSGLTATELLITVAVIAVALGLLIVAVAKAREAAARTESSNNLKNIILALHQYADKNKGRLPTVGDFSPPHIAPNVALLDIHQPSLFVRILPYVEQNNMPRKGAFRAVKQFVSPADPTAGIMVAKGEGVASYGANGKVFNTKSTFTTAFPDGSSSTIAFAEHYAKCGEAIFYYGQNSALNLPGHRASFADHGDLVPTTFGNPPVSLITNYPTLTFQVAPSAGRCFSSVAQTPHASGMLVALADGSVRQISPGVSPSTFWALVTPAGGDLPGNDW